MGFLDPVGNEERDKAIDAVKRGVGNERQKDIVAEASKQAGSVGNRARDALK